MDKHTALNEDRNIIAVLIILSCQPDVLRNIFPLVIANHKKKNKKKCSICIYEGEIERRKLGVRMSKALQTFPVCDTLPAAAGWEGSYVS